MALSFVVGTGGLRIYDDGQLLAEVPQGVTGPAVARYVKQPADVVRVVNAYDRLRRYLEHASDKEGHLRR